MSARLVIKLYIIKVNFINNYSEVKNVCLS
jgi:hypothetical protein